MCKYDERWFGTAKCFSETSNLTVWNWRSESLVGYHGTCTAASDRPMACMGEVTYGPYGLDGLRGMHGLQVPWPIANNNPLWPVNSKQSLWISPTE